MKKTLKRKKESFFIRNYREVWQYIKDSRNFIYSVIIIFLFFALFGFFLPTPAMLEAKILEYIEQLLRQTEGLSQTDLIGFIFLNNLESSFTSLLFGVLLGIFPIFGAIANGYVIGFVASRTIDSNGFLILWRLFPHGIFELPALFISLGLGVKLGTFIFEKNSLKSLEIYGIKSIKAFFLVILPLLIIAAIIEGSLIFLS